MPQLALWKNGAIHFDDLSVNGWEVEDTLNNVQRRERVFPTTNNCMHGLDGSTKLEFVFIVLCIIKVSERMK